MLCRLDRIGITICVVIEIGWGSVSIAQDFQGEHRVWVGPELEIQPQHTEKFLAILDGEAAIRRWQIIRSALWNPLHPSNRLSEMQLRLFAEHLRVDPKRARDPVFMRRFRSEWNGVREIVLSGPSLALDSDSINNVLRWLSISHDFVRLSDHTTRSRLKITHQREWMDLIRNGLYSIKGDWQRAFSVTRDQDVFEIIRRPPIEGVSKTREWVASFQNLMEFSDQDVPSRTLNPHFHMSRVFSRRPNRKDTELLTLYYRVLTALFTIQNTVRVEGISPSTPFHAGMNSANAYWHDNEAKINVDRKGNVRLYPSAPEELRLEFRSLGNIPWDELFKYLSNIEQDFLQAKTVPGLIRLTQIRIAQSLVVTSPQKFAQAILMSTQRADHRYSDPSRFIGHMKRLTRDALLQTLGLELGSTTWNRTWHEIEIHLSLHHSDKSCITTSFTHLTLN